MLFAKPPHLSYSYMGGCPSSAFISPPLCGGEGVYLSLRPTFRGWTLQAQEVGWVSWASH